MKITDAVQILRKRFYEGRPERILALEQEKAELNQGNIIVGYRQVAGLWHANALQFDIIGTGRTKDAALRQLKELVIEHLASVIKELRKGHKVAFFNPADSAEWVK